MATLLRKMMHTVQLTVEANRTLSTALQLERSFSETGKHSEARQRAEYEMDHYKKTIASACNAYRDMELELVATGFRFPDRIRESLKKAAKQLGEFGHLVQSQRCDAADVKNAELAETYKAIMRQARGWRLTNPLEAWSNKRVNNRISEGAPESVSEFDVEPERMDRVMELVHKRFTTQAGYSFAVHPPKCVLDEPDMLQSDDVIEKLKDERFKVVFQDGTAEVVTLPELVFFAHQLIMVDVQARDVAEKLKKGGFGPTEIQISFTVSIQELMQPEVMKTVLSKVEFSSVACEDA
ncbi:MAG TPA: hypothetical protein VFH53_04625 [Phycisphaerae bacterium]|nr:hypothetical protein [Phycisphaerae bacterium]